MESNRTPYEVYYDEVISHVKKITGSRKTVFGFKEALLAIDHASPRVKVLIKAIEFLKGNPLKDNDYYKYLSAYKSERIKLNEKYFRHDIDHLRELYERYEDDKGNPFNIEHFRSFVLFMSLKLKEHYTSEDEQIFNVSCTDSREYNPLSKIPTILRSCLPFEVMEFDIKRAFPTFIDIELQSNYRETIYDILSKKEFSTYLNCNIDNGISIEDARKKLSTVYAGRTNEVLTDECTFR